MSGKIYYWSPPKCEIILAPYQNAKFFNLARKSDNYGYRNSLKSDNGKKGNIRKKKRNYIKNEAKKIKINNVTRNNREKSNIAIAIMGKIND